MYVTYVWFATSSFAIYSLFPRIGLEKSSPFSDEVTVDDSPVDAAVGAGRWPSSANLFSRFITVGRMFVDNDKIPDTCINDV